MKITKRDAARVAISYGEIFDYPLTKEEVRVWAPYIFIRSFLASSQGTTLRKKRLIAIRKQRESWAREKWVRAQRAADLLKLIPTITLVGVTGGLARNNAKAEDDIDFLIIAAPNTLWMTRALSTVLLNLFRLRRRPADMQFQNLICLNMFMSQDGLSVSRKERDLFTAHEVLLMKPLWERENTYTTFLNANRWVKKFLPNVWKEKCRMPNVECRMKSRNMKENLFGIWHLAFSILEPLARALQLSYMRNRRSTEVVSGSVIRFHPRDARVWIKRSLGRRLARFNIPLDKIFYGR